MRFPTITDHSDSDRTLLTVENQDVARLYVSVDYSLIVQELHGRHQLSNNVDYLFLVQVVVLREPHAISKVQRVRLQHTGIQGLDLCQRDTWVRRVSVRLGSTIKAEKYSGCHITAMTKAFTASRC